MVLYIRFLIITGLMLFVNGIGHAQCNTNTLVDECSGKLNDFTFLKSYKLTEADANGEVEFSYVFSKDTKYFLSFCDGSGGTPEIEVKLLDKNKKMIATNYLKKSGKYYPGIAYNCSATGIYYMSYKINNPSSKCSVSVIGFKK